MGPTDLGLLWHSILYSWVFENEFLTIHVYVHCKTLEEILTFMCCRTVSIPSDPGEVNHRMANIMILDVSNATLNFFPSYGPP